MSRPLLHVGYHKTGTTLLQRRVFVKQCGFSALGSVDDKYLAFVGVNAFDFDPKNARVLFNRKIKEAREQHLVPTLSFEHFSGSPHRGGRDSRAIADRLCETFPKARILIVIREQSDMLLSLYKTYVRMGGPASFREYLYSPTDSELRASIFRFDYLEYDKLIGYYQQIFGKDSVLVMPYELLAGDPSVFLGRIDGFTGTHAHKAKLSNVNVSPAPIALMFKQQANRWVIRSGLNPSPMFLGLGNDPLKRLTSRFSKALPKSLKSAGEQRWRDFASTQISGRYEGSNAITQELTGLDLKQYGYAL